MTNEKRLISVMLVFVLLGSTAACNTNDAIDGEGWTCIPTFDDFRYQMTEISRGTSRYELKGVRPSAPWVLVRDFAQDFSPPAYWWVRQNVELTRGGSHGSEVWIRDGDQSLIAYNPLLDEISYISTHPIDSYGFADKNVVVRDFFETNDGVIMGINNPASRDTLWENPIPLLSIYNEATREFQFYDIGVGPYHIDDITWRYIGMVGRPGVILATNEDVVWIYQQRDGLFRYDPQNGSLVHHQIEVDGVVQQIAITPDGNLLLRQEMEDSPWSLSSGELLEYNSISGALHEIEVPVQAWPDYGLLLYTDSRDLWLGIHGYRASDGEWNLENPKRRQFLDLGRGSQTFNWAHPRLISQTSNGYLWYTLDSGDYLGVNGTAWYDPATETGCWFTTESGIVVEDSEQTLWMLAVTRLYKYVLNE